MSRRSVATMLEDDARYRIHEIREIISVLRALQAHHALISLYVAENDFMLSSILAIRPDLNDFVLDCSSDRSLNARVLRAQKLRILSWQDHIRIDFESGPAQVIPYDNEPAFALPLPASLLRLQRREFYRFKVPMAEPMDCHVVVGAGPDAIRSPMRILDISCGGMALVDIAPRLELRPNHTYRHCCIELPDNGAVVTDIEVLRLVDTRVRTGEIMRRCGCRFVNMDAAMVMRIQRYIIDSERKRLSRK